jgi:hypothetical protein
MCRKYIFCVTSVLFVCILYAGYIVTTISALALTVLPVIQQEYLWVRSSCIVNKFQLGLNNTVIPGSRSFFPVFKYRA